MAVAMLPPAFTAALTTLAFLWRIERRDGIVIGLTSHDRDLLVEGLRYRATPGMTPSAIERDDGFDTDTVTLSGALSSDLISDTDLAAGRWDAARLRVSLIDWSDPAAEPLLLIRGELGLVQSGAAGFSAELRGPSSRLDSPAAEETSPSCRASLGDRRCGVAMAGRRRMARVTAINGRALSLDSAHADGIYAAGMLRWLDGANAGLDGRIAASAGTGIMLRDAPAFAPSVGERVLLIEGCDRRFSTCVERFGNALNFRGEPHLPGNDMLIRYGG